MSGDFCIIDDKITGLLHTTRECKGSNVLCNDSLNHQTSAYQVSTCKLIFVLLKVKLQSYGLISELSLVKHEEICRHDEYCTQTCRQLYTGT